MPVSPGDILKGKGISPASIRVLGVKDGAFVVEAVDEFGPPFTLTARALASDYGASPDLPESEADLLRRVDAETTHADANALLKRTDHPPPPRKPNISEGLRELAEERGRDAQTPEETFQAAAADDGE